MAKITLILVLALIISSCTSYESKIQADIEEIKEVRYDKKYLGQFNEKYLYYEINGVNVIQFHEHSCCSGAGYDLVLLKFEDGEIYKSNKNYCVGKIVFEEIEEIKPKDVQDVKFKLISMGFEKLSQ
jgi:hypothetical protein